MIKKIHINQHVIRQNKKTGDDESPITVKTYKNNHKVSRVEIKGNSELVYSPNKPLDCGATVWIETEERVDLYDKDNKYVMTV